MQKQMTYKANSKSDDHGYKLIWMSGFVLILPTLIIKRLLPTQWRYWSRNENILTVVRDSKEQASIMAGMACSG